MSNNLKISEAEFSVYINKLSSYSRFLSSSLDSYIKILDTVLQLGINDQEITKAISELKENIKPIATNLESSASSVKSLSGEYISSIETEDKFKYSDEGMSSVFSILSMFL